LPKSSGKAERIQYFTISGYSQFPWEQQNGQVRERKIPSAFHWEVIAPEIGSGKILSSMAGRNTPPPSLSRAHDKVMNVTAFLST
jgi:hypothetical protein